MKKLGWFYIGSILLFALAVWFVLDQGKLLESSTVTRILMKSSTASQQGHFFSNIVRNSQHPLAILIVQIFTIMIVARAFGYLMTKIGQPSVVGEIVAGIALGPSLLGMALPEFSEFLFPDSSLKRLQVLSQIGLVLFMFVIGMELDINVIKKKARDAVMISHSSIIFPYFLGVALAYYLYAEFAPKTVPFSAFALFMGIAMSITAFPVLARIVQERNLTHTALGTIVITCAAADDITAWCLLALVVAIVSAGGLSGALGSIILSVCYVLFMWFLVRPILKRVAAKYDTPESISKTVVAAIFSVLLMSSYLTEIIGIHALFGAFLAGVVMPAQKEFKLILSEKIEDISLVLFLPLFFVFTGLRTQIGLLNQPHLWSVCVLIIAVAVAGKFFGSALAARFVGQRWKDSLLIGVLMNTRGLMELVVLNIGYDLGVLSAEIFTMMVLMALSTTFMTGPAISFIDYLFRSSEPVKVVKDGFNVLLSFGAPKSGRRLLEVAHYLNLKNENDQSITAVHFSPSADISITEAQQFERDAFVPIDRLVERFGTSTLAVRKIFRVTDQVEKSILEVVNEEKCQFTLVGGSRQLFADDKIAGKVRALLEDTDSAVGVFVDKGFKTINRAVFVIDQSTDVFLMSYAERFLNCASDNHLTVMDVNREFETIEDLKLRPGFKDVNQLELWHKDDVSRTAFAQYDVVIVSLDYWENRIDDQEEWLHWMPSVLIINK